MQTLEIFIGLFFVFLVISTLVTSISEIFITKQHVRSKVLRKSIRRLLCSSDTLEKAFFDDPEITSLIDPKRLECVKKNKAKKKPKKDIEDIAAPAHLEGSVFTKVFLRLFDGKATTGLQLGRFEAAVDAWSKVAVDTVEQTKREQLARLLDKKIEEAAEMTRLRPTLRDSDALFQVIHRWYDEGMERSRGIYRRAARKYIFWSALVITVLLNADTIHIVRTLSVDEAATAQIVSSAAEALNKPAVSTNTDRAHTTHTEAVRLIETAAEKLETSSAPIGWDRLQWKKIWPDLPQLKNASKPKRVKHWITQRAKAQWDAIPAILLKVFGLGATVIAASLGAPFWYDLLNKLVNLRGSVGQSSEPASKTDRRTQPADPTDQANAELPAPQSLKVAMSNEEESFSIHRAFWTAAASKAAYLPFAQIPPILRNWGFIDSQVTIGTEEVGIGKGTQGFIAANNESIIVAFRGTQTNEAADILADIQLSLMEWPIGPSGAQKKVHVHTGITEAYKSVSASILSTLKKLLEENPDRSIWLTGHSLGGALATLCAAELYALKIPISGLYTFGSPRVGNREFADFLKQEGLEQIYRFVNEDDPITEIPPEVIHNYCHVGQLRYLDRNNRIKTDRATWNRVLRNIAFVADISDQEAQLDKLREEASKRIGHHKIDSYLDKIALHSGHNPRDPFA